MKNITFNDRLRYRFDNYMAKGTAALISGLFGLSLVLIVLASMVVVIGSISQDGGEPLTFSEAAWVSLMRTLDAGTMGGDTGWGFRVIMFIVTLGGVFIISTLIGVLTTGVDSKMEELRKGRSLVIEEGHTVILGWSPQVFSIVSEIVTANSNHKRACIAILAQMDKVEMEDAIRDKVGDTGTTRIVCRTGNPIELTDLEIVNPHRARSIIVISPDVENPDVHVIKTILAITNNANRRLDAYHIVAAIRDPRNMEAARLVGKDEAQIVLVDELIARITAQTCRQSGLSVIYTELLDFGGDEIYFYEEPALIGKTFRQVLSMYEDSTVMGIGFANGDVKLLPSMETTFSTGDKVIAISEDDDTIRLSGQMNHQIDRDAFTYPTPAQNQPERTLIIGWNSCAPVIINELDRYVAPGSQVTILADVAGVETVLNENCEHLEHLTVSFTRGDTTSRRMLEAINSSTYSHIIVLSYPYLDMQEADAKTLVTLLHLREISEKSGREATIVSEMLDLHNRELAEVARADDFIISDRLISLLLSQVSENKSLMAVFNDLFDPEGAEIYLKPAGEYIYLGRAVNFYSVVESAAGRGEIALGYRIEQESNDAGKSYGVHLNPNKSERVIFQPGDRIILLAED